MRYLKIGWGVAWRVLVGWLIIAAVSEAQVAPVAGTASSTYNPGIVETLELRDPTQLAAESLTNGALTGAPAAEWSRTGDFSLTVPGQNATYTDSAHSGTFSQTSAAGAIPWASAGINGWFSFTYTVSTVTGAPACTIPNTFALTAQTLQVVAGTYTLVFQAMATTVGDFKVSCTSAATETITFDTLSLKQVNGGGLTVQGRVLAGQGSATLPTYSFIAEPNTGMYRETGGMTFATLGVKRMGISSFGFLPGANDTYPFGFSTFQWTDAYLSRSTQGSKSKSLTDGGAAVAAWTCAIPSNDYLAGEVIWSLKSTDATNFRVLQGRNHFTAVNKAGTVFDGANASAGPTTTMGSVGTDQAGGSTTNTVTCTWTQVINTTNLDLKVTCTDDIAGSQTMTMNSRLDMPLPQTCTPQ